MLVLSLFPGIGLLDRAFEEEGYTVVRGPDVLWGGDIRRFHPPSGRFDGVIGGPPCQMFSRLAHMVRQNGLQPKFGNLIPEFERCVIEANPQWFVMENVPDAPVPFGQRTNIEHLSKEAAFNRPGPIEDYYSLHSFILNNRWCMDENGQPAKQNRVRRWTFGYRGERRLLLVETSCFENSVFERAALGGSDTRNTTSVVGKRKTTLPFNAKTAATFAVLCEKQGLPSDFLKDAPFTIAGKCKAVGNGVPLPMGRAIARAIREAVS